MKFQRQNFRVLPLLHPRGWEPWLRSSPRPPAFTLIELIVVIVIIGIISVMAAPDYLAFRQKLDLKNSVSLLQSALQEAYSLSRSRSKHYILNANAGDGFYQLRECQDYSCLTTNVVTDNQGNPNQHELAGRTQLDGPSFEVKFLAPHGDLEITTPTGATVLTLTLDNQGLKRELTLYSLSGLVTTDTP